MEENRKRIDALMVSLGVAPSREKAKEMIKSGNVYLNGKVVSKAGLLASDCDIIEYKGESERYVSRGGLKLEKAVDVFKLDLNGYLCIDIGASTGGFTDCMLQNGAKKVYAVDSGSGQLSPKLKFDPRVVDLEKTNFRYITEKEIPERADFASADVSFISLKYILPALSPLLKDGGSAVCLIKPQFEAGRENVGKKGVVKDPRVHIKVIKNVCSYAVQAGFSVSALDFFPCQRTGGQYRIPRISEKGRSAVRFGTRCCGSRQRGARLFQSGRITMMFAIIPNLTRKNAAQVTRLICAKLDELGAAYSLPLSTENVFSDTKAEFLPEKELLGGCEAVITVGGDGTIIHSAKKAAVYSKPVLGINAGRLAFMAGLEIHELDLLEKLITGDYSMDKRMMLKTTAADGDSVQSGYSMNDSTVMRLSRLSRISEINVDLDGRYFNRYLGDGLILSTPTGSTAYSLSAGGPVVDPKLECMILTPICSHSVFTRSLVLGDDAVLRIYSDDDGPLSVSCDGDEPFTVSAQGSITVEKADICASFIRLKNDSFVDILNRKMMKWNSSSHDEREV